MSVRIAARPWPLIAGGLLSVLLASGCEPPGKPDPANRPLTPDQIVGFDQLYQTNCSGCHGANGNFGAAPPLNDPLFIAIVSKDDLLQVIRNGRPGTPMPGFDTKNGGALTAEQISVLADGIKEHWKSDEVDAASLPTYATQLQSGPIPSDRLERGAKLFSQACAGCHGPDGNGGKGADAGPLHVPAFLELISNQALRRIMITGRPDLGMPTYHDGRGRPADFQQLTSEEIEDLVALLAHWRATGNNVVQTAP